MTTRHSLKRSMMLGATRLLLALMSAGCGGATTLAPGDVDSLAALGASDVVGVGATRPDVEGWAPVLASFMPEGTRFIKVGVSGWQAHQVLDFGLPEVLQAQPDTVVLFVGVNDFLAEKPLSRFQAELEAILKELAPTEARVLVLNLPNLDRLPAFRDYASRIRQALPEWQQVVSEVCSRHGAQVINLADYAGEIDAHPEYLSSDGFHPSSAGYRRLAEIIYASLTAS